jgi:hypothetical protein
MKLIILIAFMMLTIFSQNISAQDSIIKKSIAFDPFTLPESLVKENTQYLQHSMDIVLSDSQFELTIGAHRNSPNLMNLSLVIVETKDHFYGEVRTYDPKKKKFVGVVALDFNTASESVEKVRIAVTEALLGKQYVMSHLLEIQQKAKVKFPPKSPNKVIIATPETKLLTDKFEIKPQDIKAKKEIPPPPVVAHAVEKEKIEEVKQTTPGVVQAKPDPKISNASNAALTLPIPIRDAKKPDQESIKDKTPQVESQFIFDTFVYGGQLQITTEKNIKIITTIGHVGVGVRVKNIQINIPKPLQFTAELQIARPLKKENYSIPMWRKLDLSAERKNIRSYLAFGAGVEFEPLYFIALPNYGEGLTVIDNTIYWAYLIAELNLPSYKDKYVLGIKLSKSLLTSSSTSTKLSGVKINLLPHFQINDKYSFDINFQRSFLNDEENKVNNQLLSGFVRYQF